MKRTVLGLAVVAAAAAGMLGAGEPGAGGGAGAKHIGADGRAAGADGIPLREDEAGVRHVFLQGPGVGAGNDNGILVDADGTTVSGVEASGWRGAIGSRLLARNPWGGGSAPQT